MSLNAGRTMLLSAHKELLVHWEKASELWDDAVSREFRSRYLDPMEPRVRVTVAAMEEMAELVARARRACQ